MALGQQLMGSIFQEPLNKSSVKHVRGIYTGDRNFKIACRFYLHFNIAGLRYERCLNLLQKEFDLSETRVAQLIMQERETLDRLKKERASRKTLQKKLPYFNWH